MVGAIVNIRRGGQWGTGWTVDPTYGHTGVIYGLNNGRIQTIEQNAEQGKLSQNMTDYILLILFNRLLFHQNNERRIFQWLNGKQR